MPRRSRRSRACSEKAKVQYRGPNGRFALKPEVHAAAPTDEKPQEPETAEGGQRIVEPVQQEPGEFALTSDPAPAVPLEEPSAEAPKGEEGTPLLDQPAADDLEEAVASHVALAAACQAENLGTNVPPDLRPEDEAPLKKAPRDRNMLRQADEMLPPATEPPVLVGVESAPAVRADKCSKLQIACNP